MRKCSVFLRTIRDDASHICEHCGENLIRGRKPTAIIAATPVPSPAPTTTKATKLCPFCAEEIKSAAIVCKHCHADLVKGVPAGAPQTIIVESKKLSPGVAALLSLIIPGAGQMYCGRVGQGLMWLFFTVVGYFTFIIPGLGMHLAAIITASSLASEENKKSGTAPSVDTYAADVAAYRTPADQQPTTLKPLWWSIAAIVVLLVIGSVLNRPARPSPTTRTYAPLSSGNRAHDLLVAMLPPERSAAFTKLMIGGDPCGNVTSTFFAGLSAKKDAMWSVKCSDGHDYQITVSNDAGGSTRVLSCATLKLVGKLECFVELKQQ